jgi:putative metallohydrolase (TIGR04338 family)
MVANVTDAVYTAEHGLRAMLDRSHDAPTVCVHGSTLTLPVERKFACLESIQRYIDAVLNLNWVKAQYENAQHPIKVRERQGQRYAHYEPWTHVIAIPPHERNRAWAMRELVVLHELAHHLDTGRGHSETFTDTFVTLVSELMGPEAGFVLRTLFYDENVRVGK